jgi:putative ABC transport system permease protein
MADGSRSVTARGGRLRRVLVGSEVATAVLLLFGGGLLLRTLLAVEHIDRGYREDQVLTMMVDPLGSQFPTPPALLQFFETVEDEILTQPGVRSVAWSSALPLGASDAQAVSFEVVGAAPLEAGRRPVADSHVASHTYFDTIDLPIVEGRPFTTRDTRDSMPVCIVSEAFVRGHLQGRSPIGTQIAVRPADAPQAEAVVREIVGVARQMKARPDEQQDTLQIYRPLTQGVTDDMYLLVRPTTGPADRLTAVVRDAISRVDRAQLVSVRDVMTLADVARDATERHRFRAVTVVTFAGLALLLATVGVFGIMAYAVQQQERDYAIRRALGATTSDVLRLVASDAASVVLAGAGVGLVLAAVLARFLGSLLFGVEPVDPLTLVAVTAVTLTTAALAAATPAWRAARIEPAAVLRG